MKNYEIINAFNILSQISLRKVEKQTKSQILVLYGKLSAPVAEIEAQRKAISEKCFADEKVKEQIESVSKLREEYKTATTERKKQINEIIISQYSDVLTAEHEVNEAYGQILEDNTKLTIAKIPQDKFIDALDVAEIDYNAAMLKSIESILN